MSLLRLLELTNFDFNKSSDSVTKFTDRYVQASISIDIEMNEDYSQAYGTNIYTFDKIYSLSIPDGYRFCKTIKDLPLSARNDLNDTVKILINSLADFYGASKIKDVRVSIMDSSCDLTIGPAKYMGS